MQAVWENTLKIRAFDVDANNRLKISTIFNYFQDAASLHADNLKIGYDDLIPKGYFWVLSWTKFEFNNYPKFKDEVKIQTWGKRQYRIYSIRDFIMRDINDRILCKATTAWPLLDTKTFRPKILTRLFPEVNFLEEKSALDDLPGKLPNNYRSEEIYSKQIKYSDIDLNGHANNAKYIELMLDCFDEIFHKNHTLKSLTVSFNSESRYGDQIKLSKTENTGNQFIHYIEAKNLNSSKLVFNALAEWN